MTVEVEDREASELMPPMNSDTCREILLTSTSSVLTELLLGKNDAASEASLVVSGLRSGVRAIIDACVRTNDTIQRFGDDPDSIDAFLAILVDANIISKNEARLGKASPKLVKLCAIGAHRDLLTREEVFEYLEPGYTVLYQVIVLYNALPGDENARFEQLVQILRKEGTASREVLSDRTAAVKRAKRSSGSEVGVRKGSRLDGDISRSFDLVLLTPDRRGFRRLAEDYVGRPYFCQLAQSLLAEQASAIVVGLLGDLPVIENKLLPMLGFQGPSHVLLVREPIEANVTDAEIAVIAGRKQALAVPEFVWLSSREPLDVNLIADRLVSDAERKLHLFAEDGDVGSVGWLQIIGDSNWSYADE